MPTLDYARAHELLEENFPLAEQALLNRLVPDLADSARANCDILFTSKTQAYREVLLGCTIARLIDRTVDIRQPYIDQGPHAFTGRSLDERVVNPFLQDRRVPSSRGGYLSVFRRSVQFNESIRSGLRDKEGYDAFLAALSYLETVSSELDLLAFLRYMLYKFADLREAASVPLSRLQRISLSQYDTLITGLLATQSGGLFPVLLVVGMFETLKSAFGLAWEISWQGINVADAASKAGGDITISVDGQTILAVEVTERPVEKSRLVATFNNKITPAGLEDYLFFVGAAGTAPDARTQAHHYFAQGHEVNFVDVREWLLMSLATVGKAGRMIFNKQLMDLLETSNVPQAMRVNWNDNISALLSG